ncbi:beta-xylosidase [Lactobacillus sp. M0392]|nr:beta-xylosidase [Lactobacillus sp. M0392]MBI0023676.1 beta-xylosidase [Lactobacillus sp. W8171]MBI0044106.1 beta-xylosidase [Lactobacillus sp. M0393]
MRMLDFKINSNSKTPFPHYWEMCVGSSHAYTALRADYQEQLTKVHQDMGIKFVRFHGLFDDEMSVCIENLDFTGKSQGITYNFVNIDKIYDFLLKIGMKPFVELSFMPSCLASKQNQIFPYGGNNSMPKSDKAWEELITKFIEHILERYGKDEVESWYFEVWNEPNLSRFFSGTKEDYFHLYEITVRTAKKIDEKLRFGGPATSYNSWIPDMIDFCQKNNLPLDFISTHHYPTDDPLWESGMDIDEFFKKTNGVPQDYPRGILKVMTSKTREEAQNYPLFYTEWSVSAMVGDSAHDTPYGAAMVAKTLADNDGLVEGYDYWAFSDIFEEESQKPGVFHGGFGLQTVDGIEKPVYRLFEIFHNLGDQRIKVEDNNNATAEILAVQKGKDLQIVAYNHNVPKEPIKTEQLEINLDKTISGTCEINRIDENHANPKKLWQEMGEPTYVNNEQVKELRAASQLKAESLKMQDGKINLELMPQSCALITVSNYFE